MPRVPKRGRPKHEAVIRPKNPITTEELRRRCEFMVDSAMAHDLSYAFNAPVDPDALGLPTYFSIVKNPMDLDTAKRNLIEGQYQTVAEFMSDIRQVWANCFLFNHKTSEVYDHGVQLAQFTEWIYDNVVAGETITDADNPSSDGIIYGEELPNHCPLPSVVKKLTKAPPETPSNDAMCAICELGDHLLLCDGPCLRSFHTKCIGLDKIPEDDEWYCNDCAKNMQTCLVCGKAGEPGVSVQKCAHPACGRFYHLYCATDHELFKLKGRGNQTTFICPRHTCATCKQQDHSALLNVCSRCVNAYHNGCIPNEDPTGTQPGGTFRISYRNIVCPDHANKRLVDDAEQAALLSEAAMRMEEQGEADEEEIDDPYGVHHALDHLNVVPIERPTIYTAYSLGKPMQYTANRRYALEAFEKPFRKLVSQALQK